MGISAVCVDHDASSHCSCTVPSQCDGYDPDSIMYCNTEGPIVVTPCPEPQTCSNGACVDNVPTTTLLPGADCPPGESGWFLVAPDCQSGYFCSNGVALGSYTCLDGEYFDPELGCQPAPPVPCTGCGEGPCPNKLDCASYYVCDANGNGLEMQTCASGSFFDSTANPPLCVIGPTDYESNPKCPPTSVCTGLVGTTVAGGGSTVAGGGTTVAGGGSTVAPTTECNEENQGNYPDPSSCKM